jgi:hypothetical protein
MAQIWHKTYNWYEVIAHTSAPLANTNGGPRTSD